MHLVYLSDYQFYNKVIHKIKKQSFESYILFLDEEKFTNSSLFVNDVQMATDIRQFLCVEKSN